MLHYFRKLRLSIKLVLLICVASMLPLLVENILIISRVHQEYYATAGQRVATVAGLVADSPHVQELLLRPDRVDFAEVDTYLTTLSHVSQVRFIVIINMQSIRVYHPQGDKIGKPVVGGDETPVLEGKTYLSSARGTFGPSLRGFRPIYGPDGAQIGAVIVGKLRDTIDNTIYNLNRPILLSLFCALLLGVVLAVHFARSIKDILLGLEPAEIATLLEERNAVLRTVREGIVAVNADACITLVNDAGLEVLRKSGINGPLLGHPVRKVIPGTRLDQIMLSGQAEFDCEQHINDTIVLTNRVPLRVNNTIIGAIATFRDMTEIRKMAEELTGVNRYVNALRSQSHEFLNKLHVIYGLLENGHHKELSDYLKDIIGIRQEEHEVIHHSIKDPVVAGFLSSKFSRAREMGTQLTFHFRGVLPALQQPSRAHALVTILGNLIDNGLEAVQHSPQKKLDIFFHFNGGGSIGLKVRDTGTGMEPEMVPQIFTKGWSSKGSQRGIGLYLVLAAIHELNGTIEVDTALGQGACFHVHVPAPPKARKTNAEDTA